MKIPILIKIFGECSGLKANFEKTQAVWIGAKRGCGEEIRTVEPIIWNHEGKFKLLGIKYELLNADHFSVDFNEKLQSVQTLLSDWSLRNLSLVGKVTVVKTLAFPILVQILTVLPNPSMQVLKRFQTVFFNFIWNGKIDKVKREILINDYDEGGLKVPDIFSYCKALKISWIKRYIDPFNFSDWKKLLTDKIETMGGDKFWGLTKQGLKLVSSKIQFGHFWTNVIHIWADLQENFTAAPETILSQPLWYNELIKINRRPYFYKNLCENGIFYINDIIDDAGNILSYQHFIHHYNLNINILTYNSLVSSIPRGWKRLIKDYGKKLHDCLHDNLKFLKIYEKPSRVFYMKILKQKTIYPKKAYAKWENALNVDINTDQWKHIHYLPFKETKDTKLQTLQFRICHRIFFTNTMLMKCHLLEHELCTFCNDGRETIIHLFWECTHSQTIWTCLINSINENYNITLERRPEFFILGFPYEVKLSDLHLLILLIKKFIALSRQYNKVPDWNSCKNYIVSYKKIDLYSAYLLHPKTAATIRQKWQSVEKILS